MPHAMNNNTVVASLPGDSRAASVQRTALRIEGLDRASTPLPRNRAERRAVRTPLVKATGPRLRRPQVTPEQQKRFVDRLKSRQAASAKTAAESGGAPSQNTAPGPLSDATNEPAPGLLTRTSAWLRTGWPTVATSLGQRAWQNLERWWPHLPGAQASSCTAQGRCMEDPPLALAQFAYVVQYLKFELEASPALMARDDASLAGVIVLIADMNHYDADHYRAIRDLLHNSLRVGADKLLVESATRENAARDGTCKGFAIDEVCQLIEDPEASRASEEAAMATLRTAQALIAALERLGAVFVNASDSLMEAVQNAETAILQMNPRLRQATTAEVAAYEKARARYDRVVVRDAGRREAHFLERIRAHAGDGHVTYVVLGSAHIANLKAALFDRPALLVHDPAMRARAIEASGRDPLAPQPS